MHSATCASTSSGRIVLSYSLPQHRARAARRQRLWLGQCTLRLFKILTPLCLVTKYPAQRNAMTLQGSSAGNETGNTLEAVIVICASLLVAARLLSSPTSKSSPGPDDIASGTLLMPRMLRRATPVVAAYCLFSHSCIRCHHSQGPPCQGGTLGSYQRGIQRLALQKSAPRKT